jgi:hypothetical protein
MPVVALSRAPQTEVRPATEVRPTAAPVEPAAVPVRHLGSTPGDDEHVTRIIPPTAGDPGEPPALDRGSRAQRRFQLLGLGAVTAAAIGYAPYAATILVALVVLALRAWSIGRERHTRRRTIRGRARWFDVPATTLSTPGYLVLALFGALLLVGWAAAAAIAFGVIEAVVGPPLQVGMLLLGVVFTAALWWGPGADRVRKLTGDAASRFSRSEYAGLFVIGMCVVLGAVLVAAALGAGPNWGPATGAPWRAGILADVARHL